jgi:hypothetical protein
MFVVFYIVKVVYICVFMTCSTLCCLCDKIMDPWKICMCIYVSTCLLWQVDEGPRCQLVVWAAQRHHGKKGSWERGSKMAGTTNHLADQWVEGRLEGGMVSVPTVLPLSNHRSPSLAGCFTMSTCPQVGLPLPHRIVNEEKCQCHFSWSICGNGLMAKDGRKEQINMSSNTMLTFNINFFNSSYTGCNRRKVPNFGRVFLMLNYMEKTQNTYIQSWTVTEIKTTEKCAHLWVSTHFTCQLTV